MNTRSSIEKSSATGPLTPPTNRHGTVCQACDLDFKARYGEIGAGFIEAHHLKPISTLEEGVAVTYDVESDFAVLCANCHRMIHRTNDPSDLAGFKKRLSGI